MRRFRPMAMLLMLFATAAAAAPDRITKILEQQRQHGFDAPASAIRQLEAVRADAGPTASLDVRMRYHAALTALYIGAEQAPQVDAELQTLERMASAEKCSPCRHYKFIREIQWAVRRQDVTGAKRVLDQIEALPPPTDRDIRQALHYVRAAVLDSMGDHDRAIEEGLQATQLAAAAGNPADQVRSLNVLLLSNIGRRDLDRAEALANEAYALAERIGFTYMMAYLRGNQGWLYSLRGEPEKQLRALQDALRITRSHPGLGDAELVTLANLAEYHATHKSYREAIDMSRQAIVLAERQDKPIAKGVVMATLGDAQVQVGEVETGLATMRQAIALLADVGAKSYHITAMEGLANTYQALGRHREALETLRKAVALKEDVTTQEREKALAEAQEKFSAERKDLEIERLSLESARRQAEVSARTWQQRLWAAAAVALALGGALLILLVQRTRMRNRLLEVNNAVLSAQSVHDPLTGVFNRRHCHTLMNQQEALLAAKSRDRQYSACVGLILLDVDHFKAINDVFGHVAGDGVLIEIAQRLQHLVRQQDTVIRWGGEEFVLVLPGTPPEGIAILAERVLHKIADEPMFVDDKPITVTISAGCVAYPLAPGEHWESSLQVADFAMYLAKQRGRNRAICLMQIADGAQPDIIKGDLAVAEAAGHVVLRMIEGPTIAAKVD